eukprot:Nk52_evm3s328 gene=Nk52_evmTU3s328
MSGEQVLTISLLEARYFPKRPGYGICFEIKFNGECSTTDTFEHVYNFDINTDLIWEMTKKTLHEHKLQRTSLKLVCYAVDLHTNVREQTGYVMFPDLRSAQQPPPKEKWISLLGCKYQHQKPQILYGISLESPQEATVASTAEPKVKKSHHPRETFPVSPNIPFASLTAHQRPDGYYQIGNGNHHFLFSLSLPSSECLEELSVENDDAGEFYFSYGFLGQQFSTQKFSTLVSPSLLMENDNTVSLRSSMVELIQFFKAQPQLKVFLRKGEEYIAVAKVDLSGLVSIHGEALCPIDSKFILNKISSSEDLNTSLNSSFGHIDEGEPCLSVSISVTKELPQLSLNNPIMQAPAEAGQSLFSHSLQAKISAAGELHRELDAELLNLSALSVSDTKQENIAPSNGNAKLPQPTSPTVRNSASGYPGIPSPKKTSSERISEGQVDIARPSPRKSPPRPFQSYQKRQKLEQESRSETIPVAKNVESAQDSQKYVYPRPDLSFEAPPMMPSVKDFRDDLRIHHFRVSVDLRSIRNVSFNMAQAYLRYTYPYFGSPAPVFTNPPVEVRKGVEYLMPQAYCGFEFASSAAGLADHISTNPLTVELWHKDKYMQDVLLGIAKVNLGEVLGEEKTRAQGEMSWMQTHDSYIAVIAFERSDVITKVAEVRCIISLEDIGVLKNVELPSEPPHNTQTTSGANFNFSKSENVQERVRSTSSHPEVPQQTELPSNISKFYPSDIRQTEEYQVALDLEMWKQAEEEAFISQLKKREAELMKTLGDEWKKRDQERELAIRRKEAEYLKLEQQLKRSLLELEDREKMIIKGEDELKHVRKKLIKEYDQKLKDIRDTTRRISTDLDHELELERKKSKAAQKEIELLEVKVQQLAEDKINIENAFNKYKIEQSNRPGIRELHDTVHDLQNDIKRMKEKLESSAKAKKLYKQQWLRSLQEITHLKQEKQTEDALRLQKDRKEVEAMKLKILAKEEEEYVKKESARLNQINNEIENLKLIENTKINMQRNPRSPGNKAGMYGNDSFAPMGNVSILNHSINVSEQNYARLLQEKESLLKTGSYSEQDPIIHSLNSEIRRLGSKLNRSVNA